MTRIQLEEAACLTRHGLKAHRRGPNSVGVEQYTPKKELPPHTTFHCPPPTNQEEVTSEVPEGVFGESQAQKVRTEVSAGGGTQDAMEKLLFGAAGVTGALATPSVE